MVSTEALVTLLLGCLDTGWQTAQIWTFVFLIIRCRFKIDKKNFQFYQEWQFNYIIPILMELNHFCHLKKNS